MSVYAGIDLGTSAVKLLLMGEDGKIIRTVSKEYPINFPKPGWSEQNPEDWFEQSFAGLDELTEGYKDQLKGISFGRTDVKEDELKDRCTVWLHWMQMIRLSVPRSSGMTDVP